MGQEMNEKRVLRGAVGEGCSQALPMGGRSASRRQGQAAPEGPVKPGRAWAGGSGVCGPPPRSPGTSRVTVCTAGRAAPRVIYDPLPLAGGGGGSGLGPAAEGPERGDREQRRRRRGGRAGAWPPRLQAGPRSQPPPAVPADAAGLRPKLGPKSCPSGLWLQSEKCTGTCGPRCQTRPQIDLGK